jgi:hypothetical protein
MLHSQLPSGRRPMRTIPMILGIALVLCLPHVAAFATVLANIRTLLPPQELLPLVKSHLRAGARACRTLTTDGPLA